MRDPFLFRRISWIRSCQCDCERREVKWFEKMIVWPVALLATTHASFGRAHGMALCRKWAAVGDDARATTTVVKARMALEHPSAFAVASADDEDLVLFVCSPVGRSIHRVDAAMWTGRAHTAQRFRALRRWHRTHYPDHVLIPGASLEASETHAWEDS